MTTNPSSAHQWFFFFSLMLVGVLEHLWFFLNTEKMGTRSAGSAYQACVLFIAGRSDIMERTTQRRDSWTACNSVPLCSPRTSRCLRFHGSWNFKHFTHSACTNMPCICECACMHAVFHESRNLKKCRNIWLRRLHVCNNYSTVLFVLQRATQREAIWTRSYISLYGLFYILETTYVFSVQFTKKMSTQNTNIPHDNFFFW